MSELTDDWQAMYDRLQGAEPTTGLDGDALEARAEAAFAVGRVDEAIETRERAYVRYEDEGNLVGAAGCAVWLTQAYFATARPSIGGAWMGRSQQVLTGLEESAPYGFFLVLQAFGALARGQPDSAEVQARQAVELGRRLRQHDVQAIGLQALASALIAQDRVPEGMARFDESMLFAVEGRLTPFFHGAVYCGMIATCEDLGDIRRAAEWTEALTRWTDRHPYSIFPGVCRAHRATVLQRHGSWPEAEEEARRACVDLEAMRMPGTAALAYAEIGDIRRRLGDADGAESAFRRAEELGGQPQPGLALLRLSQGNVDAASAIIARALAERAHDPLARAKALPAAIQIAVAMGDLGGARTSADELEAVAAHYDSPALRAGAASSRGRLQLAEGDPHAACATLNRALRLWQDLDVPYEAATVRLLLGEACRGAGDEDGAKASFGAAARLFERVGAVLDAKRIDDALRAPTALPAGLTDREGEVLRLVAAGLSNKQIAARLYLSDKTVARHLSNIFLKIGVSTRSAATAFAFERGITGPNG
ncbi:MAG: hypothetical protein QOG82_2550 [Actinomycetota bacterium]|jgi:ATP/maltotriose-dependent transcriptional regulator MalT|nr:hypothetical protein [Actinomycetota bacterium]